MEVNRNITVSYTQAEYDDMRKKVDFVDDVIGTLWIFNKTHIRNENYDFSEYSFIESFLEKVKELMEK